VNRFQTSPNITLGATHLPLMEKKVPTGSGVVAGSWMVGLCFFDFWFQVEILEDDVEISDHNPAVPLAEPPGTMGFC